MRDMVLANVRMWIGEFHFDGLRIDAAHEIRDEGPEDHILTDLAGAVTGGIGLAASANINPSGEFPSMFEPVHGSAPDIAGKGIADPTAAISSMALLLDHLGKPELAKRIDDAVSADIAERGAQKFGTVETGDRIAARLG